MNDFLYLSLSTANKIETREPIFSHIQENIFSIFIKIKFHIVKRKILEMCQNMDKKACKQLCT